MQIGFVEQRQMTVGKDQQGNNKTAQWLEVVIKVPGMREFSLKMVPVQPEQGKRMPAYQLYYRANQRKGEQYRDLRAGALWLETSLGGQTQYLSGHIETPVVPGGRLRIAMFNSKPLYENESITWLYDVIWSPEKTKQEMDEDYDPQYGQTVPPAQSMPVTAQQNSSGHSESQQFQQPAQAQYTHPNGQPMTPAEVQVMQNPRG